MKLGLTILLLVGLLPQLSYGRVNATQSEIKNSEKLRSGFKKAKPARSCQILFGPLPKLDWTSPNLTIIDVFKELANKPRTGAISIGISESVALKIESIYDHVHSLKELAEAYIIHFPNLNLRKVIDMILTHDNGEFVFPDYNPRNNIDKNVKRRMEKHVFKKLKKRFGSLGNYMYKLFIEYEYALTPEALFTKPLDKFQAGIKALSYKELAPRDYYEFYENAMSQISDPVLKKILTYMYSDAYSRLSNYKSLNIDHHKIAIILLRNNGDVRKSLNNLIKDSNTLKEILSYHEKEYLELL